MRTMNPNGASTLGMATTPSFGCTWLLDVGECLRAGRERVGVIGGRPEARRAVEDDARENVDPLQETTHHGMHQ